LRSPFRETVILLARRLKQEIGQNCRCAAEIDQDRPSS
jgi:hypothetical protein